MSTFAFPPVLTRNSQLFAHMQRTSDPSALAVRVSDAKRQSEIEHCDDDALLKTYVQAATAKVENDTRTALITQTWALYLDDFDDDLIQLRRPPVQSVSSVTYTDTDGDSQTVTASNYQTDINRWPGRVYPAFGVDWPDVRSETLNGVTVTFVAGFGATHNAVPPMYQHAILLLVDTFWRMRCSISEARLMPAPFAYDAMIAGLVWDQ